MKRLWQSLRTPDTGEDRRDAEIREHLANERTLLAWVRTGIGLISIGFVIERAGVLAASQFPDTLVDATGTFHRPPKWR